jgi:hypothetical protein
MDWRLKLFSKKSAELVLTGEQLTELARVCLDVQSRSIEALGMSMSGGMQVRHELFMTWVISYHVTQQLSGVEHHLSVTHDGTIPPEFRDSLMKDALRILAYGVRVSRLSATAPFEMELAGLGVRRMFAPDQSKKLKRGAEFLPKVDVLSALWTAATSEATALSTRLNEPIRSSVSGLRPAQ